jgi:hypothetical protein
MQRLQAKAGNIKGRGEMANRRIGEKRKRGKNLPLILAADFAFADPPPARATAKAIDGQLRIPLKIFK